MKNFVGVLDMNPRMAWYVSSLLSKTMTAIRLAIILGRNATTRKRLQNVGNLG
jgi:hypothetical protein